MLASGPSADASYWYAVSSFLPTVALAFKICKCDYSVTDVTAKCQEA